MKKRLANNKKNRDKIEAMPKVYLVACWAKYGVREYPFAGKWVYDKYVHQEVPLVYDYDDHNGTDDAFYLRKLTDTTTGFINSWSFNKQEAQELAQKLESNRRIKY